MGFFLSGYAENHGCKPVEALSKMVRKGAKHFGPSMKAKAVAHRFR